MRLTVFSAIVFILIACNGTLNPPSGPDTAYPCGIRGVSCGGGACCPEAHVCGYDGPWARCEAGYCCYDGPHWPGAGRDAGRIPQKVSSR